MKLSPRYHAPAPIVFVDEPENVLVPLVRQRKRLEALLADLAADEWSAPSRCAGWAVQDVVAHLAGVNDFWTFSIASAVSGSPTQVLAEFDPVAVPAEMVATVRSLPSEEIAQRFAASNARMIDALSALDADGWAAPAESPAGHVSVAVLAHHGLWDCLVHEWDIALPLQRPTVIEPDEVIASLAYGAALSAALVLLAGGSLPDRLMLDSTDPRAAFVYEIGDSVTVRRARTGDDAPTLHGDAVALFEIVSARAPLPATTTDAWQVALGGLRKAFDHAIE